MIFKIYMEGGGWACIDIEIESKSFNYNINFHVGDTLTDLLEGITILCGAENEYCFGIPYLDKSTFSWQVQDDWRRVEFNFKKIEDKVNMQILNYDEEIHCVFDNLIDFNDLLEEIIKSCTEILKINGFIGYLINSGSSCDFPIAYYLILKK